VPRGIDGTGRLKPWSAGSLAPWGSPRTMTQGRLQVVGPGCAYPALLHVKGVKLRNSHLDGNLNFCSLYTDTLTFLSSLDRESAGDGSAPPLMAWLLHTTLTLTMYKYFRGGGVVTHNPPSRPTRTRYCRTYSQQLLQRCGVLKLDTAWTSGHAGCGR
jgi:hypothetical protein